MVQVRRFLPVILCAALAGLAYAQSEPPAQLAGSIDGATQDPSGAVIAGAVVTLEPVGATTGSRTTVTDQTGQFHFSPVTAGAYKITVTASGFDVWTANDVSVASGNSAAKVSAVLQVAPNTTRVTVGLPPHELAAEQLQEEEKQRLVGIFPNYFVTYKPDAAPLTAAQKFQLGWKTFFDPVPILFSGIGAGIQQGRNSFPEYGQGVEGYWKRFGANYADRVDGVLIGHVVTQAVFHQDPRYFYKGTGSFGSRLLYAIGTAFVAKGDNGHWQPAYADVVGGLASYELSTLYRPGTSRPGLRVFHTFLLGFSGRASGNLIQEFLLRYITTHVPKLAGQSGPELPAGTPVSLISAEDLSGKTAAGPIGFVLAGDLRVDGAVIAKAGAQAWGRVSYHSSADANGEVHVDIESVHLTVGKVDVPLRSTQIRGAAGGVEYHRLENSGRIAIVLYVDRDVAIPPA